MRESAGAPLAPLTTFGLGGPAERLITVDDEAELVDVVRRTDPGLILGGGSNLVLPDEGLAGTVVQIATQGVSLTPEADDVLVEVQAGESWDALVAHAVDEGLAGIECLAGIPGLVGGTPIQNVGAYGQEVAQTVVGVRVLDRSGGEVVTLTDLGFAYRWSRFKAEPGRWVVLAVTYRLRRDRLAQPVRAGDLSRAVGPDRVPLDQVRDAVLALRRGKGMVLDPSDPDSRSAGSFFTNPIVSVEQAGAIPGAPTHPEADGRVKLSAAWLIEQAGFAKGAFDGPVGLSTKHTLAIVHRGGGTTADLLRVARAVRSGVHDRFGILLEAEPVLVGQTL
ncbi:MAG: UDP-N-acetylmuramate dehydrogenase [Mycobacteriales bacterium]